MLLNTIKRLPHLWTASFFFWPFSFHGGGGGNVHQKNFLSKHIRFFEMRGNDPEKYPKLQYFQRRREIWDIRKCSKFYERKRIIK